MVVAGEDIEGLALIWRSASDVAGAAHEELDPLMRRRIGQVGETVRIPPSCPPNRRPEPRLNDVMRDHA